VTGDRFVWQPDDVEVAGPATGSCQACGKPADDDQVPGLCRQCASTIDRDTDWLREVAEWEAGS
jgi:hypothetical protein